MADPHGSGYILDMIQRLLIAALLTGCGSEYGQHAIPPAPPDPPEDTAQPPEVIRIDGAQEWLQRYEIGTLQLILYVDKSGSMNDLLPHVGEAAVALAEAIDPGGPWSILFVTTHQGAGATQGPYDTLAQSEEIRRAPVRLNGGPGEQGLGAVWREAGNPGTVHVVFSDEDDQSFAPPGFSNTFDPTLGRHYWTISEWVTEWGLWAPTERLILLLPEGGCGTLSTDRYHEAATLTGAEIVDLCGDWDPWLGAFNWPWTDPQTDYTLAEDPIPATVRVTFDGAVSTDWTLTGRTVHLNNPPPIGSTVRITYSYWSF